MASTMPTSVKLEGEGASPHSVPSREWKGPWNLSPLLLLCPHYPWISSGPSGLPKQPTFVSSVCSSTVQDYHRRKITGSRAKQRILGLDTKKAQSLRGKTDQSDLIEVKRICSVKDTIWMKRQAAPWEKILASHLSDKKLVLRIYKELSKRNSKSS